MASYTADALARGTAQDTQIKVRLNPNLKEALEAAAIENARSTNAEIAFRLKLSFEKTKGE